MRWLHCGLWTGSNSWVQGITTTSTIRPIYGHGCEPLLFVVSAPVIVLALTPWNYCCTSTYITYVRYAPQYDVRVCHVGMGMFSIQQPSNTALCICICFRKCTGSSFLRYCTYNAGVIIATQERTNDNPAFRGRFRPMHWCVYSRQHQNTAFA